MYSTSRNGNPSNNKRRNVSVLTPIIVSLFDYGCDQLTSLDLCHPLQMQINSVIHYLFKGRKKGGKKRNSLLQSDAVLKKRERENEKSQR